MSKTTRQRPGIYGECSASIKRKSKAVSTGHRFPQLRPRCRFGKQIYVLFAWSARYVVLPEKVRDRRSKSACVVDATFLWPKLFSSIFNEVRCQGFSRTPYEPQILFQLWSEMIHHSFVNIFWTRDQRSQNPRYLTVEFGTLIVPAKRTWLILVHLPSPCKLNWSELLAFHAGPGNSTVHSIWGGRGSANIHFTSLAKNAVGFIPPPPPCQKYPYTHTGQAKLTMTATRALLSLSEPSSDKRFEFKHCLCYFQCFRIWNKCHNNKRRLFLIFCER